MKSTEKDTTESLLWKYSRKHTDKSSATDSAAKLHGGS